MIRTLLIRLFFVTLIFGAAQAHAQYNDSLIAMNSQLQDLCEVSLEKIDDAFLAGLVDSNFSIPVIAQLKAIHQEILKREDFLYQVQCVNNITDAKLKKASELEILEKRLKAEWKNYHAEMEYCQAFDKIYEMIPAFSNNKKIYYAEDKFFIPSKYYPQAQEVYKPMVDSIFSVVEEYPNTKFEILIKTIGYSDESKTAVGSMHYNDMANRLQSESITDDEINNYMSYLRSFDVADILKNMIKERQNDELQNVSFRFAPEGKGTALPSSKEKYKPIDEKRRMVEIYWHILPLF